MSGYLTTNENGEFTGTVTGLTAGQKVITATFEGDDEYNRSTTNKHITIIEPTIELSLTTPTEIIEVGSTSVITATLTKNSLPYVNQEITYEIKHGSTLIDRGSDFTNNAGQITISYTGTGVGDVDIIASFGSSMEETFVIEDCLVYRETLSSTITDLTLPAKYKLEFDIPNLSNGTYASIGTDSTHRIITGQFSNQNLSLNGVWIYNGSSTATQNNCPTTPTQNAHYTFTYENGAYTMSNGGSNISGTIPTGINMQKLLSSTYTPSAVRNYKIKAL